MRPVSPESSTAVAATTIEEAVEHLATNGYVVLPDVIPAALVDTLRDRIDETIERDHISFGTNVFLGHRTRRVFNLLSRHPDFAAVPLQSPMLGVVERVLGRDLLLSSLTAIDIHPGQDAQPLHADDAALPVPRPHQPLGVVAIWALTDFTADNGGTRLVPGSHLADRRPRHDDEPLTRPTEMRAGSVIIYNGSLWHGGGANRSAERRIGIVCNYYAGWLRQEENQMLALTRDQVAAFPPRLRALIGYSTYRGLHGHVAGVDPGSWFEPDLTAGSTMVWDRIR